jgi:lipocalin-like protein
MLRAIAFAISALLFVQSAIADDREKLMGTWKVISFDNEFQDGSPRRALYGQHPTGFIILTAEGRMMAVVAAEGRKPATNDEERASLLRTMFAYSGMYRLDGDKWITNVDVSWNSAYTGTEQVRFYKLDGNRLEVTGAWGPNPNLPGSPITRGIVLFERAK